MTYQQSPIDPTSTKKNIQYRFFVHFSCNCVFSIWFFSYSSPFLRYRNSKRKKRIICIICTYFRTTLLGAFLNVVSPVGTIHVINGLVDWKDGTIGNDSKWSGILLIFGKFYHDWLYSNSIPSVMCSSSFSFFLCLLNFYTFFVEKKRSVVSSLIS